MNIINPIIKSSVFKNGLWLYLLQFANTVLPLLTIPYITRILGAVGYGQFSVAYNWITYFQVLVEYGYTLNGARKIAISKDSSEENRLWRSIVCSRAVLFFFSLIILNLFYIINRDPVRHKNMMILMLIVLSVVFQMNWLFQGKQEMKFITIVNLTGRISSMILIFLFVMRTLFFLIMK